MAILAYLSYIRSASTLGGALMLMMVVWFLGPGFQLDHWYPLESPFARAGLIALIAIVVLVPMGLKRLRTRRAAKALEGGIAAPRADDSEVLAGRMKDALATLKTARGGAADALYSLPWYIIIGPPGAGKTTALVNSRIKFPLMGAGAVGVVEGVGGTRYCDWWFAEDAVLIDTAGRYTTQDSGSESAAAADNVDRRSWLSFLDLLRRNRPKQPINGVIVAFGVDDLVNLTEEERFAHADAIRTRLVELHEQLKITFPVYMMVTKADLIDGFQEFFGDLREKEREIVWGATFQTDERTQNTIAAVPGELDALILRLSENHLDRLQAEPNQARRAKIFGFPAQFNALREPLIRFLARIFEPTRYHSTAILRGFYFTSGTQEGTTLDQLIGATSRAIGTEGARMSGKGRSFFIRDLLTKVIFAEAGWVSTNRAAVRRARLLRIAGIAIVVLVSGLCLTAFGISYAANRSLVAATDKALEETRVKGGDLVGEVEVRSPDLDTPQRDVLWPLRTLPAGFAFSDEGTPLTERFGLSQRGRLNAAATETYHQALERSFRSRLVLRVEQVLQANLDDPVSTYETLKVYRMLTGERPDDAIIAAWVVKDWEQNLYPGPLNASGRAALRAHLDAMLALDDGRDLLVEPNKPLVAEAERVLARIPLADAAYARLRQEAGADPALFDWRLVDAAGADADKVFTTLDGTDLPNVTVPAFFTAAGFQTGVIEKLVNIEKTTAAEEWLIGTAAKQPAYQAQYSTLKQDVLARYQADDIAVWKAVLDNLALKPMAADKPAYVALRALSAPASPLRQLVESVVAQTALTTAPAATAKAEGTAADPTAPLVMASADPAASRDAVKAAVKGEPGAVVEAAFVPLAKFAKPESKPSLGSLIGELDEIYDRLTALAGASAGSAEALAAVTEKIEALRTEANRLPDPVNRLILAAVRDLAGDTRGTRADQVAKRFNVELTEPCRAVVDNRFPFFLDSARDVGLEEFSAMFKPGGAIDAYRTANLDPYIDKSAPEWRWTDGTQFSAATLAMFRRAAQITATFFPDGKDKPNVGFVVTTLGLDPRAISGVLKIGETFVSATGGTRYVPVAWPGEPAGNSAAVAVAFGTQAQTDRIEASGPWALFRLVGRGRTSISSDRLNVDFVVAGLTVSFAFSTAAGENPLTLPALSTFRCPTGL